MAFNKLFLNLVLCLVATVAIVACTGSSDSGDPAPPPPIDVQASPGPEGTEDPTPAPTAPPATPSPTSAPTPTPLPQGTPGEFLSDGPITEAETLQFYKAGCLTPGAPDSKKSIDPRMKVGDKYRDTIFFGDPNIEYSLSMESTVQAITFRTSDHLGKVLATNFPGVKVGQTSHTKCEVISDTEGECQGDTSMTIEGMGVYIFIPLSSATKTFEVGWYILDNGFGVPAWRSLSERNGFIADPMTIKIVGAGTERVTMIHLPDVPYYGLDFCGGAEGLNETLISLDNGMRVNRYGGQLNGVTLKK